MKSEFQPAGGGVGGRGGVEREALKSVSLFKRADDTCLVHG